MSDESEKPAARDVSFAAALARLERLRSSPEGARPAGEIEDVLRQCEEALARLTCTHAQMIHQMLDALGVDAVAAERSRTLGRVSDLSEETRDADTGELDTLVAQVMPAAYHAQLDRQRGEIDRLQESLADNVKEVMTQSRELGAMLQIELSALQQAEGAQEVEHLRRILIEGIEELIAAQRALDQKLNRTRKYLRLIRSDSRRLQEELEKARLLSLTDEFTGLPNRRAFVRRLQDETGRAERYGSPLALVLVDLDEFKAVNDRFGHAAGDEVLRHYASHILTILRHHDLVARYGGEEFAVLLPNTTVEGALAAIDKLKERAQAGTCTFGGKVLRLPTFSAGLTMYVTGDTNSTLMQRADQALYRAKHMGRDRTEIELMRASQAPLANVDLAPNPDPA